MPDASSLAFFSMAAIALLVVPGPAVLYIVARSIDQGRAAGFASVAGVHAGSLVHITAAALGISAILSSSAAAFSVVKYAGAVYLLLLGIRTIRSRSRLFGAVAPARQPLGSIFRQGMLVNVLNPKTALFFFAFLPQFVSVSRGSVSSQVLMLGLLFIALGLISDSAYALLAAKIGMVLRANPRFDARRNLVSGSIYVVLGILTALTGSRPATS